MKKQDWRDIQDLAANTFKAFGLDYQRGISKEITGKEHLNNLEFKIQKMEEKQSCMRLDIIFTIKILFLDKHKNNLICFISGFLFMILKGA